MHAHEARGAAAYRTQHIQTRSPLELVVLLYDSAIDRVVAARQAIDRADVRARGEAVSRALGIVAERRQTLDVERGGEIAERLDALYAYLTGRLMDVTVKGDAAALDEAQRLLSTLRDAWSQIAAEARR